MDIDPEIVLEDLRERVTDKDHKVRVFWLKVEGDRDAYSQALKEHANDLGIVPLIVRTGGFQNPNSVFGDFIALLSEAREEVLSTIDVARLASVGITFVLLGRAALRIPQLASPVALPEWIPVHGGTSIECIIQDLSYTVRAAFSSAEIKVHEIASELHAVESALLKRLTATQKDDHRKVNAFADTLRNRLDIKSTLPDFLQQAEEQNLQVTEPGAYRPSVRAGKSLLGCLLALVTRSSPDELNKLGRALGTALNLDATAAARWTPGVVAVLSRSAMYERNDAARLARGLLVTLFWGAQFVTSAAHADQYPRYPVVLLRGVCQDIVGALINARMILELS